MKIKYWFILIIIGAIAGADRAHAAAIDDIQIIISSSDICDGSFSSPQSFVVYARNNNSARPISATFQYDSTPSSQSFALYDVNFSPYTDRFPKSLVIRVAAGATVPIGCTYNYRPSSPPSSIGPVPVVVKLTGAAYVNPSQPNPPPEDARAFTAWILQEGFAGCPAGVKPAGLFFLLNLHPYARLTTVITITINSGAVTTGRDVAPLSIARVGCSNEGGRPTGVAKADLVYPPGQKKQ